MADEAAPVQLLGGYHDPYDPWPALCALQTDFNDSVAWDELWEELHHQGGVDTASYVAVIELIRLYESRDTPSDQMYQMVATIDSCRRPPYDGRNPAVPVGIDEAYHRAIGRLAEFALEELRDPQRTPAECSLMIAVVAIAKSLFALGSLASEYSDDDELRGYLSQLEADRHAMPPR